MRRSRVSLCWSLSRAFMRTTRCRLSSLQGPPVNPAGVVHTHRNVLASLGPIEREIQKYLKYERIFHPLGILNTLPLSHVFGQFMGIWVPPLLGAVVYFESRLIGRDLTALIRRERISVLAAVPRVLGLIESHLIERFPDLPARLKAAEGRSALHRWWMFRDIHRTLGLKFWALISGGATLDAEVEHFWTTMGFVVVQGYGMTETAALGEPEPSISSGSWNHWAGAARPGGSLERGGRNPGEGRNGLARHVDRRARCSRGSRSGYQPETWAHWMPRDR